MANKNFRVRNGLEIGDGVTITEAGAITGIGTLSVVTVDAENLEVTNIKARDGSTAATIANSTGQITFSAPLQAGNISISGNTVISTNTNGNINLTPNGTGDVVVGKDFTVDGLVTNINSTTVQIRSNDLYLNNVTTPSDVNAIGGGIILKGTTDKTITWNDAARGWMLNQNLDVTGNIVASGTLDVKGGIITESTGALQITTGAANGAITLNPNGTGNIFLVADTIELGNPNTTATLTTNGTGNLVLNTNEGTNAGNITLAQGVNGNITLTPNGTGSVVISKIDAASGEIDGTVIGANTAAAATFTTATATTGNITTVNATTVDTTNLEVTNIKAKDGTAAATIADTTGVITVSTELNVDNLNISGNTISSTNTNGDILITPNGTGDVDLVTDTVQIGDVNATATLTTNGTGDLVLNTNSGTNAGNITLSNGVNGNITVTTNGTGNIALNTLDGGNVVASRNFVDGAIRNSGTQSRGNIWELLAAASPTGPVSGVSVDNSQDQTKTAGLILRNYGATAGNRGRFVFERSRGTAASPSAVVLGDFLGEVDVTGYTTAGWLNDLVAAVPAFYGFNATENWTGTGNCGTQLTIALQPTATTLATGSQVNVITMNPQNSALRSDTFTVMQGKTTGFVATGCSISGTTLTIGTVTSGTVATGQMIQNATSTISPTIFIVSGSGSTWTLNAAPGNQTGQTISGRQGFINCTTANTQIINDLRLFTNNIQSNSTTTQIVLSNAGATLELRGDTITLESSAGTDYMVLNNSKILNNRPHRNVITSATVTEGTTYSPTATDNNSISLTINTGSGTTVIDLANLTGQGDGGMYSIMVHNNAASGTPIQVKNTRINTNNLMTHTIGTGDRIMITAYIVGDYATAEHLNVA